MPILIAPGGRGAKLLALELVRKSSVACGLSPG